MNPAIEEQASLMHTTAHRMRRDSRKKFKLRKMLLQSLDHAVDTGEMNFAVLASLIHEAADHLEKSDG